MSVNTNAHQDLKYPELYGAAELVARDCQRRFYFAKTGELIALGVGAMFGIVPSGWLWRVGPLLSMLAFLLAIAIQISRVAQRAEMRWYDARAAAESIKSASWQYAVRGEAFRSNSQTPDKDFVANLSAILHGLTHLDIGAATPDGAGVTEGMRQVRSQTLADRHSLYRSARIADQVAWYSSKAESNRRGSRGWWIAILVVEFGALIAGFLRLQGILDVDLLGVATTIAAGLLAWTQAKNFTQLAESYAVTSHEIALVAQSMEKTMTEVEWAQGVHDAEAAFSREHTLWVARRQGPPA
jgi:hypothetical protein